MPIASKIKLFDNIISNFLSCPDDKVSSTCIGFNDDLFPSKLCYVILIRGARFKVADLMPA